VKDVTGFFFEIGVLKRYPRTGWSLAGVPAALTQNSLDWLQRARPAEPGNGAQT
jgi:hypothetical protein